MATLRWMTADAGSGELSGIGWWEKPERTKRISKYRLCTITYFYYCTCKRSMGSRSSSSSSKSKLILRHPWKTIFRGNLSLQVDVISILATENCHIADSKRFKQSWSKQRARCHLPIQHRNLEISPRTSMFLCSKDIFQLHPWIHPLKELMLFRKFHSSLMQLVWKLKEAFIEHFHFV